MVRVQLPNSMVYRNIPNFLVLMPEGEHLVSGRLFPRWPLDAMDPRTLFWTCQKLCLALSLVITRYTVLHSADRLQPLFERRKCRPLHRALGLRYALIKCVFLYSSVSSHCTTRTLSLFRCRWGPRSRFL